MTAAAGTCGPVRWDRGIGAFVVTGFDAASAVLRGQGWSSDPRRSPLAPAGLADFPTVLAGSDPPDHSRTRRLVAPAFTQRSVEALRPRVRAIVDAALDGLEEIGPVIDVVHDIGYPVSLAVISELLDVGTEGARLFADLTPELMRGAELDADADDAAASAGAGAELMLFLTPILAARRARPGKDFISALLAVPDLDLHEVLAVSILLLVAGHETTANLVANSALALLQDPDQIPHLYVDPAGAVEELLRCHGPAAFVLRTALVDQDLAGQRVRAGQAVLVALREANRDPDRFPGADRLDLARPPAGHLAFGAGIHFCLGAALARLECAETLTRLFGRYPAMRLCPGPPEWRRSTVLHALRRLDVRLGGRPGRA